MLKFVATIYYVRAGCWLERGCSFFFQFFLYHNNAQVLCWILQALMLSLPCLPSFSFVVGFASSIPTTHHFLFQSLKTGAPDLPDSQSQRRGVGCLLRYPLIMMPTKHVLTKITKKTRAREFCDPTRFELVDFPPSNRQWRD